MSGKRWPLIITGWLGLVIGVNIVLFTLAQKTQPGSMEEKSPYEVGREFESDLEAQRAFKKSGLNLHWSFEGRKARVTLEAIPPSKESVRDWSLSFIAKKTDDPSSDIRGDLKPVFKDNGVYESEHLSQDPQRGLWFLRVELRKSDRFMLWKETLRH